MSDALIAAQFIGCAVVLMYGLDLSLFPEAHRTKSAEKYASSSGFSVASIFDLVGLAKLARRFFF